MHSCLLFGVKPDVMKFIFLNIVIMNTTLFTNMMSRDRLMLVYLSCISDEIPNRITIYYGDTLLVAFPFSGPRSGPNIY